MSLLEVENMKIYVSKNDEIYKFDEVYEKYKNGLKRLEDEYRYHL